MKIINYENGKKKAYVQLNDLMMLMQFSSLIPAEVMDKIFSKIFIVTDENRFEFAEFVEDGTIEFFEGCDWILDYRDYRGLSEENIIEVGQQMSYKMREIAQEWNAMTPKQKEKNQRLKLNYDKLEFKVYSLAEIMWTKQGNKVMPFPVVPDSSGFVLDNDDCPYIARQGINPLQVLIYRKDGKVLDRKTDKIPVGLVQSAFSVLIDANLNTNEFFGDFESTRDISEDGKYLVTTFKMIPSKKDTHTKEEIHDKQEEPKTLRKRIKNWINKKRSN